MDDLTKILLASASTGIFTFLSFIAGYLITRYILDPLYQFWKLKHEIECFLYTNDWLYGGDRPADEIAVEAEKEAHLLGGKLGVYCYTIPCKFIWKRWFASDREEDFGSAAGALMIMTHRKNKSFNFEQYKEIDWLLNGKKEH